MDHLTSTLLRPGETARCDGCNRFLWENDRVIRSSAGDRYCCDCLRLTAELLDNPAGDRHCWDCPRLTAELLDNPAPDFRPLEPIRDAACR